MIRAFNGHAPHVTPDGPCALLSWDGYVLIGVAPDLRSARRWAAEDDPGSDGHGSEAMQ
jgi:hypothetical protein